MCFDAERHVTDSDALRRISWEAGQSVDTSPEMIHCVFLIPMQAQRRDLNFACAACVCIQDKQKTLLRLTGQRSPSVSSDPTSLCVTQPTPSLPPLLSCQHLFAVNTPQLTQSLKTENSSDSDSSSSFKDKQRRKTSLSLSDQGRQDGKQRETAETQSVCLNVMNVSSARLCVGFLRTPSAPSARALRARLKLSSAINVSRDSCLARANQGS